MVAELLVACFFLIAVVAVCLAMYYLGERNEARHSRRDTVSALIRQRSYTDMWRNRAKMAGWQ